MSIWNEIATAMDWLGTAESIYKDLSPSYDSKIIDAAGRTPNQAAKDEGEGWKAGFVDYETGIMNVHKRRERK